jgi:acyl-homoserine-lactone acylase
VLTRDYAENSNDSYWLPSAGTRIEGMPQIVGIEGTPRELRTRGLIAEIEEQKARAPYTRAILAKAMLSNRSYAADLVIDESVALCRALPGGVATSSSGASIDVSSACDVLAAFDNHMNSDSPGARLFAAYWVRAFEGSEDAEVLLWKTPFDAADPVNTPRALDADNPLIAQALADAVEELEQAGEPLDATLGDHQYVVRNGAHIPIGGGTDSLAVMNLVTFEDHDADPTNASGYMHVVSFDGDECPDAVTLLGYSQSSEPTSAHYADQTQLYSNQKWVTERFCESAIQASPELEILRLTPPQP